ncbi:MAG TPA: hypothetical protein VG099_22565 [Gemmataceae bacterium]|nr:hypothetical protein [Gemmataceae bacterium]
MRKLWAWGLATVLCAGLAASNARARDDDDDTSQAKPPPRPAIRWSHYFAGMETYTQPKPEAVKPAAKPKQQTAHKPAENPKPKNPAHEAASERAREEAILMRRLEVCDKLKEIALRTNDGELFRRAEVLDERARTTYAQRTSYLGGNGGLATDTMALDRNLEAVYPKTRAPESTAHTVADGNSSRASDREVNR